MKTLLSVLVVGLAFVGCKTSSTGSSSVKDVSATSDANTNTAALTANALKGSYTGQEQDSSTACQVAISIADSGLFFTPYMTVKIDDQTFTDKASTVNTALGAMGDNDAITLTSSKTTGILASVDSTLQLFITNGAVTGLHYQTAAFSGGFIQGQWTIIDCSNLVAAANN